VLCVGSPNVHPSNGLAVRLLNDPSPFPLEAVLNLKSLIRNRYELVETESNEVKQSTNIGASAPLSLHFLHSHPYQHKKELASESPIVNDSATRCVVNVRRKLRAGGYKAQMTRPTRVGLRRRGCDWLESESVRQPTAEQHLYVSPIEKENTAYI